MKLHHRRQFLQLVAGAAAVAAVSRIAWAQAYPTRSVRMIVPFPAGGSTDVLARLMGQRLSVRRRRVPTFTAPMLKRMDPAFSNIRPVCGCCGHFALFQRTVEQPNH